MILIDTSVWIEYFRGNSEYFGEVQSMLDLGMITTVEPVFAELLYGARGKKDNLMLNSYWKVLPKIDFGANSLLEAADFANKRNFQQLGIGLMDALIIYSTISGGHLLWTLDKKINSNIDNQYIYQSS